MAVMAARTARRRSAHRAPNQLGLMHVGVTPTAKTGGEWEEAHVSPQRDLTKLVWRFSVRVSEGTDTRAREREWDGCWDQMERLPASTPAQVAFKKAVKKKWADTRYKWHKRRGSSVAPGVDGAIDLRHREVKPDTVRRYQSKKKAAAKRSAAVASSAVEPKRQCGKQTAGTSVSAAATAAATLVNLNQVQGTGASLGAEKAAADKATVEPEAARQIAVEKAVPEAEQRWPRRFSSRDAAATQPSVCPPPDVSGWTLGTTDQPPSRQPGDDVHHVVVIGAGVAGLSAAKAAAAARLQGKPVKVTVLEGRNRVGGRIHTDVMDGGSRINERKPKCLADCSFELGETSDPSHHIPVDLGASFVHGCNKGNSVWRLSQKYGAALDDSDGGYTAAWGRGCKFLSPDGASVLPKDRVEKLWKLSKELRREISRRAEERGKGESDISVEQAMCEVVSSKLANQYDALSTEERQIVRSFMVIWQGYCSSPGSGVSNSDTSAWMSLDFAWDQAPADTSTTEMASAEQYWIPRRKSTREKLTPQEAKERDSANLNDGMVVGGYGPFMVDNLARECTDAGATIYKGCVVKEITQQQMKTPRSTRSAAPAQQKPAIQVAYEKTGVRHSLTAHEVIVTLPVGVLRKSIETPDDKDAKSQAAVKFDPPLSAEKQDAIRKIGMGTENKVLLRFKLDSKGKVFFTGPLLKSTKYWQVPDERFRLLSLHAMGKPGCLLVHVSPPHAFTTHKDSGKQIVSEVMAMLRQIFGNAIEDPVETRVTQWHEDPFSLGAYSYMRVGATVEDKRRLIKAEWDGHLHFAGEGCSISGHQCVHGAYDTGEQAGQASVDKVPVREGVSKIEQTRRRKRKPKQEQPRKRAKPSRQIKLPDADSNIVQTWFNDDACPCVVTDNADDRIDYRDFEEVWNVKGHAFPQPGPFSRLIQQIVRPGGSGTVEKLPHDGGSENYVHRYGEPRSARPFKYVGWRPEPAARAAGASARGTVIGDNNPDVVAANRATVQERKEAGC